MSGVEIEFSGVEADDIVNEIGRAFGGEFIWNSPFEIAIETAKLGKFKIELDSKDVKKIGEDSSIDGDPSQAEPSIERACIETVSSVASSVVPWEVVTPPIEFGRLSELFPLIDHYRELGAQGTKKQLHYAFGVHLNPELVDLEARTIVNHLKSFFCLYEWIKVTEKTDMTRRITPYINHFGNDYVKKVLHCDYAPTLDQLMQDYMQYNPTRNRSLDLLPLFAHLDQELLLEYIDDDRINARPTFHYRFPNCDIDNPKWNLDTTIEIWLAVEDFAYDENLQSVCDEYLEKLDSPIPMLGSTWSERVQQRIAITQVVAASAR